MITGRVFLIDDHDAVLDMVRRVMREVGVDVVGVAHTGAEALPGVLSTRPDLIVLDLSMPEQSGFEIVAELRARNVSARYLAFTGVMSTHAIERLCDMHFDGVVSKMSRIQELVEAVRAVLSGQNYTCTLFTDICREHRERTDHPSRMLTSREVQVLSLIGKAMSDAEIGGILKLSATTVQGFRTKLLQKLNLSGTPQLVRFASEHGYTEFAKDMVD